MIDRYFERPDAVGRIRSACTGPHMDAFAAAVSAWGYTRARGRLLNLGVAHLGRWMDDKGIDLAALDETVLVSFLAEVHGQSTGDGKPGYCRAGGRRFLAWARERSVVSTPRLGSRLHGLILDFEAWMTCHRNVSPITLQNYRLPLQRLVDALGDDPCRYDTARIRQFILAESQRTGRGYAKLVVTAVRMLLRHLAVLGQCAPGLVDAVPTIASWRLATLPTSLEQGEVDCVIGVCDPATVAGCRDRAMLLLMARLGLRAGDVVRLRLGDIDWSDATLMVSGKGRRAVRMPLPQEVGDALLRWLATGPHDSADEHVFTRLRVPRGPLTNVAVNNVVVRAAQRAGLARRIGPGVLRHSAATAWVNQGLSLHAIGALLRHRCLHTTTIYTKVDASLLGSISRPWPTEVS